ncbi:UDP-N-acetylmuramoylalanyl-D-glutamyl-2,6-diaminopimelate--D-alanyl-D-alanine ligase [Actinomycetales bacterium JB111]|nr:UDP-N-acetylmuramoylalanyl-D-glutamyl-2,6-diaminopimelate--D-alanyl-D-alanine ligase [Actinomycetales bacterium JB111]
MITLSLTEIAGSTHASSSPADVPVTGNVVQDSRLVGAGDLFVAIAGERTDGHRHVAAALAAGAAGALVQDASVPVADGADPSRLVVVPDTVAALGDLARHSLAALRDRRRTDVVAVTGSVGKTTTKDLLIDMLSARGELVAPPGSLNNEVGLPLTVLRAGEQTATLVLEMGADRVGNLTYLTSVAPPDVAIVLAVGRAHLGHFGGIDNVARTKSELVTGLRESGVAVLNLDDPRVAAMASLAPGRVLTFSASGDESADLYATGVDLDAAGRASFTLHAPGGRAEVSLALVGRHHVANALAAAGAALALGEDVDAVATALATAGPRSEHRTAVTELSGDVLLLDDSYNANPDSMRAGLAALESIAPRRRRLAVLGQMLELGDDSAAEHAGLVPELLDRQVVEIVVVGEEAAPLAAAAADAGIRTHDLTGRPAAEIADAVRALLVPGDALLLKGSKGSGVWEVADLLTSDTAATSLPGTPGDGMMPA